MWAVKNDTNGSSAFTVTVQKSDINENLLLAFIIDGKVVVLQVKTSNSGNFYAEWRDWMADLGVDYIISPTGWPAGTESAALNDAFNGSGVDVTVVRDGRIFTCLQVKKVSPKRQFCVLNVRSAAIMQRRKVIG